MSRTILHKANTRGHADHGWLDSFHTFSFAGYYNPDRVQFGTLRVLNDDRIEGGRGFGAHPHDNMEIISIPLEGGLVHEDNLGHKQVTSAGEIQVMSTGQGVFHSEYNSSKDKPASFLQIWVFPNKLNVTPRYEQVSIDPAKGHNRLQQLISPRADHAAASGKDKTGSTAASDGAWQDKAFSTATSDGAWQDKAFSTATSGDGTLESRDGGSAMTSGNGAALTEGTWIYQDAWFSSGRFDEGKEETYTIRKQGNGAYVFVIKGSFEVDGQQLAARDGLGISDTDAFVFRSLEPGSELLIMDVPMQNKLQ